MLRSIFLGTCIILAGVFCAFPCFASPPQWQFFQIPGALTLSPSSVNDAASTTGSFTLSDGSSHAFLRSSVGRLLRFDVGALSTQPVRINTSGEIAGIFSDVAGVDQGFVRMPSGVITRFNLGDSTEVTDMNASGSVVGLYSASSLTQAFFRTKSGFVFPFTVPNSTFVYPESINDSGQITGFYLFNGGYAGGIGGFIRSPDGAITTLIANQGVVPLAINQSGTITGWLAPPSGSFLPFVRPPSGAIMHFHLPGTLSSQNITINAAGIIAGSYTTQDNTNLDAPQITTHGFLRTPQGAITSFDAPGAASTTLTAINSANTAAGYAQSASGTQGFLLIPGGLFTP